jgi:hypothetical protein
MAPPTQAEIEEARQAKIAGKLTDQKLSVREYKSHTD